MLVVRVVSIRHSRYVHRDSRNGGESSNPLIFQETLGVQTGMDLSPAYSALALAHLEGLAANDNGDPWGRERNWHERYLDLLDFFSREELVRAVADLHLHLYTRTEIEPSRFEALRRGKFATK